MITFTTHLLPLLLFHVVAGDCDLNQLHLFIVVLGLNAGPDMTRM